MKKSFIKIVSRIHLKKIATKVNCTHCGSIVSVISLNFFFVILKLKVLQQSVIKEWCI